MHEVSICQAVIESLYRELFRRSIPARSVTRVVLAVGALRQVVPDFMQEAFRTLTRDTELDHCELELKIVPVSLECSHCRCTFPCVRPTFRCPGCGSEQIIIHGGDRITLESFSVENGQPGGEDARRDA
ncbi:MAG TPA: hydrogenase maturation nickel metallochaperone HypA [Kiritimatiellae bacterium]|nr:hydrogenase maturation nickel metallochaperone HypA [Kiritimatiellia bacterium]